MCLIRSAGGGVVQVIGGKATVQQRRKNMKEMQVNEGRGRLNGLRRRRRRRRNKKRKEEENMKFGTSFISLKYDVQKYKW